jgi:hypothetical protein
VVQKYIYFYFSKSFDIIHEVDEDLEEYDEDTLVVETESPQLDEEVKKRNPTSKNIDHCPGNDSLSEASAAV